MRLTDRQRDHLLQLGHPIAPADEVRGEQQRQGRGADHPDVTGGLAAHPAERALHIPERRQGDRSGRARGGAGVGMTEISGVPAYNPKWMAGPALPTDLCTYARWHHPNIGMRC